MCRVRPHQPARSGRRRCAKATDPAHTSIPADPSWKLSTSRIAWSSSITWTMGLSDRIADILPQRRPQGEAKDGPPAGIAFDRDPPAMGLDNGTTDRQTDPHPMRLLGDKGLEQLRHAFRCNTRSGISHIDGDHIIVLGRRRDNKLTHVR